MVVKDAKRKRLRSNDIFDQLNGVLIEFEMFVKLKMMITCSLRSYKERKHMSQNSLDDRHSGSQGVP